MYRYLCFLLAVAVFSWTSLCAETLEISDANVRSLHNVSVPALEPGVLMSYHVKEGAVVRAGDVLAIIDDTVVSLEKQAADLEAEVARLQSENDIDLRFAVKSAEVSAAEVERLQRATERFPKSVPDSERAQLELQAERAVLAMEQANRDLEEARVNASLRKSRAGVLGERLKHTVIKSPTAGVVVERFLDEGEWAGIGTPLVRVISLDEVRVEAYTGASVADESLVGRQAEFEIATGKTAGKKVPCTIVFVSPEVHPVDRSVRILAEVENRVGVLRPGMQGVLRIE